jgi:hypothetical protein
MNADVLAVFASGLKEIVVDPVPVWQAVVAVAVMLVIMLIPYYGEPSSTRSVGAGRRPAEADERLAHRPQQMGRG